MLVYDAGPYRVRAHVPAMPSVPVATDAVDVSRLPGARIVAMQRWESSDSVAMAGCARGPSARFAPGLEGILFERARSAGLGAMKLAPRDLSLVSEDAPDRAYRRVFTGSTDRGDVRITELLTFTGEDKDLLLCLAICEGKGCSESDVTIEGELVEPPRPDLFVRSFFYAAEHPAPVLGTAAFVMAALTALVLWRRPYPRP